MKELTVVRENLMNESGYTPYCGQGCRIMPRTVWNPNKNQFSCPCCGWTSSFPRDFIERYKQKWHK